jgi:predicted nucleic acid-binding protein
MRYLFDTNIIILLHKSASFRAYFEAHFGKVGYGNHYVCAVTHGELTSRVFRNAWSAQKWTELMKFEEEFITQPITSRKMYLAYAEVEAYNQSKHPFFRMPEGSARNMGKNDTWIAAAGLLLKATVVTTDARGFSHFIPEFLQTEILDISKF